MRDIGRPRNGKGQFFSGYRKERVQIEVDGHLVEATRCARCLGVKPITEMVGKSLSWCRGCSNEYAANRRRSPREAARVRQYYQEYMKSGVIPARHRRYKYGVTNDMTQKMLDASDGRCEICGASIREKFWVDHDHQTEHVRGLLCRACNILLGCCKDDPDVLRKAADYLDYRKDGHPVIGLVRPRRRSYVRRSRTDSGGKISRAEGVPTK